MQPSGRIALLLATVAGMWLASNPLVPADEPTLSPDSSISRSASGPVVPPSRSEPRAASGRDRESAADVRATDSPVVPRAATRTRHESGASDRRSDDDSTDERRIDSLDSAPADVIRQALRQAIEQEQRRRVLHVAPSIVETAATRGHVRIVFDTGPAARAGPQDAEHLAGLLSGPGGGPGAGPASTAVWEELRLFPLIGQGAARVGPQALLHLIESDFVEHIELDAVHRPSLDQSLPIIQADLAQASGHDGDGLAIAILDTGIDPDHPMFADRILDEACFSLLGDCPNGESQMFGPGAGVPCSFGCGHGTRVAGVAAGDDGEGGLVGVAPQARLISIQVFSNVDGSAGAYSSDILAGLQHVLGLTAYYGIAAVNLSLGGQVYTSESSCDQAIGSQRTAVALLRDAGVATIAAAGNDGITNGLASPACLSNVIGVGSTSDADVPSSFTNSATFLSFFAPGQWIETSANGGGTGTSSGTSLATPHVAGAFAILREAVPTAGVEEITSALALTGLPVHDSRNGATIARIRIQDALDVLMAGASGGSSPPGPVATTGESTGDTNGGGGSACGLVGLEPLLAAAAIRFWTQRRTHHRWARAGAA